MRTGRGNRSTWRKPALVPLCQSQIPYCLSLDRTQAAAMRRRPLTAWTMASPVHKLTPRVQPFLRSPSQKAEKETKEEQCVLSLTNSEIKAHLENHARDQWNGILTTKADFKWSLISRFEWNNSQVNEYANYCSRNLKIYASSHCGESQYGSWCDSSVPSGQHQSRLYCNVCSVKQRHIAH
jgi:hypothetical protein